MRKKRTNILFDNETWNILSRRSREKKKSIGELTRQAIKKTYVEDSIIQDRKKAAEEIKKIRKKIKGTFTAGEIKEMINYGRKY